MNKLSLFLPVALAAYSFRWSWWLKNKKGLNVLVYHKIGYYPKGSKLKELWVTPERFEKHILWLIKNGYKPVGFSELLDCYKNNKPVDNLVLITFDDGYENNYKYAYPILKKYNVKGNIFIVYNTIGKVNIWHKPEKEVWINMATKEMLLEMDRSGVIEFGSHTMNHPRLAEISLEDARWEITESKKQLENLFQKEMFAFAYPYGNGAYNGDVRKLVLDAGHIFDFSFKQGKTPWPWKRDEMPIDRLFIKNNDSCFDLGLHIKKGIAKFF